MKKLLIATAALAMVAGTAQAQSSVTIYGGIDASYSNDERGTQNVVNNQMSNTATDFFKTSAMGFRGTEDLGGGLSASFVYEADLASSTGEQTLGSRQSHLVLASKKFGALSMGRQNDAVKDIEGLSQVYNLSDNLHFNTLVGNRYANVTKYQSPDISGFKFAYSFSDNPAGTEITQGGAGDTKSKTQEAAATLNSFNIQYKLPVNGGIDLAYGSGKIEAGAAATVYTKTDIYTGRTVINGVTVGAALINNQQGNNKLDQTIVSVNVPFKGAYELKAHYVSNKQTGSVITTPTGSASATAAQEGNSAGGDGFGVMAVYNFSKRTAAYAGFADFSGDVATYDRKTTTVGLFHSF